MVPRSRILPFLALAVCLHGYVVFSIARQPLAVNHQPPSERSPIWGLHNDSAYLIGPGSDFFSLYHAGQQVTLDRSPYDDDEVPRVTPYYFSFRYLPLVAQTLGAAAVQLSPRVAYLYWIGIMESVLLLFAILLWRMSVSARLRDFSLLVLLVSSPYFLEVHMGQFTFVTLALLGIATLLLDHPGRASLRSVVLGVCCFTVAAATKIFPLVAIPAFLRRRNGWWLAAAPVFLIALAGAPHFFFHPGDWTAFVQANFLPADGMDSGNHGFVYLVALIVTGLEPGGWHVAAESFGRALHGLVLLSTATVVLFSRRSRLAIGIAALILGHFVSYVHVWEHHMSGVIVMGVLVLWDLSRQESPSRWLVGIIVAALIVLALPTTFGLFRTSIAWSPFARYANPLCKVVPTVLLYGACMRTLWCTGFSWPWKAGNSVTR